MRSCAGFEMEGNHSPRNVGSLLMLEKPGTGILPRITVYGPFFAKGKSVMESERLWIQEKEQIKSEGGSKERLKASLVLGGKSEANIILCGDTD